jgi:hypothetical protein
VRARAAQGLKFMAVHQEQGGPVGFAKAVASAAGAGRLRAA